ncbi:hypothetical protein AZZ99_000652, partial [Serratia marcescens]
PSTSAHRTAAPAARPAARYALSR